MLYNTEDMNYLKQYQLLTNGFDSKKSVIFIDDLKTRIVNCGFDSGFFINKPGAAEETCAYPEIVETNMLQNTSFTYPVVFSGNAQTTGRAILMLHGLNERSWNKYLVWAKYLAEETGQPVILFPIAFHMNRSPENWKNPREMSKVSSYRRSLFSDLNDSSYVNAALSTRIENNPRQFLISGVQSYLDVINLTASIKEGRHPLFKKDTHIDIFSYSIGAFLSEVLVMNNPRNLFDNTKLCLFCGGATFDGMNGASKFIMDSHAFQRLRSLANMKNFNKVRNYFKALGISEIKTVWKTLRSMTFLKEGRKNRERILEKIGNQVYAIGLQQDKVMPASAIMRTLKGEKLNLPTRVEIMDFPFAYSHETPFPIKNQNIDAQIDSSFRQVFEKFANFLK